MSEKSREASQPPEIPPEREDAEVQKPPARLPAHRLKEVITITGRRVKVVTRPPSEDIPMVLPEYREFTTQAFLRTIPKVIVLMRLDHDNLVTPLPSEITTRLSAMEGVRPEKYPQSAFSPLRLPYAAIVLQGQSSRVRIFQGLIKKKITAAEIQREIEFLETTTSEKILSQAHQEYALHCLMALPPEKWLLATQILFSLGTMNLRENSEMSTRLGKKIPVWIRAAEKFYLGRTKGKHRGNFKHFIWYVRLRALAGCLGLPQDEASFSSVTEAIKRLYKKHPPRGRSVLDGIAIVEQEFETDIEENRPGILKFDKEAHQEWVSQLRLLQHFLDLASASADTRFYEFYEKDSRLFKILAVFLETFEATGSYLKFLLESNAFGHASVRKAWITWFQKQSAEKDALGADDIERTLHRRRQHPLFAPPLYAAAHSLGLVDHIIRGAKTPLTEEIFRQTHGLEEKLRNFIRSYSRTAYQRQPWNPY